MVVGELPGVADKHDLGTSRARHSHDTVKVACADHPGLVHDENVVGPEHELAPVDALEQACQGGRSDSRAR